MLGGVVPHPRSGRGTPSQVRGGTLSQVWGLPHSRSGGLGGSQVWGVPHSRSGGVPHPRSRGVPCPRSGGGGNPSQVWGVPCPMGYPPARPGMGYPPVQTWDGVPPGPDLGWGTPLPRPEMGYPPPQVWADKQTENSTFPHPSDAGGN